MGEIREKLPNKWEKREKIGKNSPYEISLDTRLCYSFTFGLFKNIYLFIKRIYIQAGSKKNTKK